MNAISKQNTGPPKPPKATNRLEGPGEAECRVTGRHSISTSSERQARDRYRPVAQGLSAPL